MAKNILILSKNLAIKSKTLIIKLAFFLYFVTAKIRELIILTAFGSVAHCKHSPTCSVFTYNAVLSHGVIRGLGMGIIRTFKCW